MDKLVKVSCPFCGHGNRVDLETYEVEIKEEILDLYDICNYCGATYAFDVELKFFTVSYDPQIN